MDKNRLYIQFDTLVKLVNGKSSLRSTDEESNCLRILQKILCSLESSRGMRDNLVRVDAYVMALVNLLTICSDSHIVVVTLKIICELVGKPSALSYKRANFFLSVGTTKVLLQLIRSESVGLEQSTNDEQLLVMHTALVRVASKDRKLAIRARLFNCLGVLLGLLRIQISSISSIKNKQNSSNSQNLLCLLQLLKLYSRNLNNCSRMGRSGVIALVLRVIYNCHRANLTVLKLALSCLQLCIRTKNNASKAVTQGGVPMIIEMFREWNKTDIKQKQGLLKKSLLVIIKNLINLRSGKKAFLESDGLLVLYNFCHDSVKYNSSSSNINDTLVTTASIVLRKCFPKNRLPIPHYDSVLSCPVPHDSTMLAAPTNDNGHDRSVTPDQEQPTGTLATDDTDGPGGDRFYGVSSNKKTEFVFPVRASEMRTVDNYKYDESGEIDDEEDGGSKSGHLRQKTQPSSENVYGNSVLNITVEEDSQSMGEVLGHKREGDQFHDSIFYVAGDINLCQNRNKNKDLDEVPRDAEEDNNLNQLIGTLNLGTHLYEAVDDRPLSQLLQQYSEFIAERDFSANTSSQNRKLKFPSPTIKTEPENELDSSVEGMSSFTARYIDTSTYVTRSLGKFSCIAYPDLFQDSCSTAQSRTAVPTNSNQQNHLLDDLRRLVDNEDIIEKVVFDLDRIVFDEAANYNLLNSLHSNSDELDIKSSSDKKFSNHLEFESQFESGNLRRAIQIRQYEYDLILNPDINTNHNVQWFYFRVSSMERGIGYRFNIINCEKTNSQFNFGMQPVMYSVKENLYGRGGWKRTGSNISYYKNHFSRSAITCGGVTGKTYFTCSFEIQFPHEQDVCYLAYHYPYTYTRLLTDLHFWQKNLEPNLVSDEFKPDTEGDPKNFMNTVDFVTSPQNNILFSVQKLCVTILGNPLPLITITNRNNSKACAKEDSTISSVTSSKKYIFLTSRVHPGESNSSWLMRGFIEFLLGNTSEANQLREWFIFKIVPMLNPDGVINGNHRCSMAGHDLNRRWLNPCHLLNPTIYHTKAMLMLLTKLGLTPLVYCDLHGHSRKKNIFLYGCSSQQTWQWPDLCNPAYLDGKIENTSYTQLPMFFSNISRVMSLKNCSFSVEKIKESTARVVVWRQFGVQRSYTVEASFCDYDLNADSSAVVASSTNISNANLEASGQDNSYNMSVAVLEATGAKLAESLLLLAQSLNSFPKDYLPCDIPDALASVMRSESKKRARGFGVRKGSFKGTSSSFSKETINKTMTTDGTYNKIKKLPDIMNDDDDDLVEDGDELESIDEDDDSDEYDDNLEDGEMYLDDIYDEVDEENNMNNDVN